MIKEFDKIKCIFKRNPVTKKVTQEFSSEMFEVLKDCPYWEFTEKIDGTNIRVHWDGHKFNFYGRTDKSDIPKKLLSKLEEIFINDYMEEKMEELVGNKECIIFGEGYGDGIQKCGKDYIEDGNDFIVFDIIVDGEYVDDYRSFCNAIGLKFVPVIFTGDLEDGFVYVRRGHKSEIGSCEFEGLVGRLPNCIRDKDGNVIRIKIKVKDMKDLEVEE